MAPWKKEKNRHNFTYGSGRNTLSLSFLIRKLKKAEKRHRRLGKE